MNNMEKLRIYLRKEMEDVIKIMLERAEFYTISKEKSREELLIDLLDIDMDSELVSSFDVEDYANHNYDLGRYYTLNEILKKL